VPLQFEVNLSLMLDIEGLVKTFVRELSLGQRMRANIAMMLLHSPEIILLDEPTLGLDVVAKRQMIEFLKKINNEDGVTIVVTSHDMDDLEEMLVFLKIFKQTQLSVFSLRKLIEIFKYFSDTANYAIGLAFGMEYFH